MLYLLITVVVLGLSTIPSVFFGKNPDGKPLSFVLTSALAAVMWIVTWTFSVDATAHVYGVFGVFFMAGWIMNTLIGAYDSNDMDGRHLLTFLSIPALWLITMWVSDADFHRYDDKYRQLGNGSVEELVWTDATQFKDPAHVVQATTASSLKKARQALGEAGAIGSRFLIDEKSVTSQKIAGHLYYVAPLDYAGFMIWASGDPVPAYVMVDAENPGAAPKLVGGQDIRYTRDAWFGNDVMRRFRSELGVGKRFTDVSFEIDDDGKPWWVATLIELVGVHSIEKVVGVAVMDPGSGNVKSYGLDSVPAFVDRVYPRSQTGDYAMWWGEYGNGWLNTLFSKVGMTIPETPDMVYGNDGDAWWCMGMTSVSESDSSLVYYIYVNSRTGKAVRFAASGTIDSDLMSIVNAAGPVAMKKLKARRPQTFSIHGRMVSVTPLYSEQDVFGGVAVTDVKSPSVMAVADTLPQAVRLFKAKARSIQSGSVEIGTDVDIRTVKGTVRRVAQRGQPGELLVMVGDVVFQVFKADDLRYLMTRDGDTVEIGYVLDEGESTPRVETFRNITLEGPSEEEKE